MTIRTDVNINTGVSPRIITVEAPSTEITIQDLHDTLRSLEATSIYMDDPPFIDTAGLENLGGTLSVGLTSTLQNMQLQFEGRTTALETGTCTSDDSTGQSLTASGGLFVTKLVARGDIVFNSTTAAMATVLSVTSETNLTSQLLSGGSRATWLNTDTYAIYQNVQCTVLGGNLVAVDEAGSPIPAILGSANTDTILALSSSATAIEATSNLTAAQVWENVLEGSMTAEQMMRIFLSALGNKASGLDTLTPEFRDLADSKPRITAVTDANGNRSSVTLDGT